MKVDLIYLNNSVIEVIVIYYIYRNTKCWDLEKNKKRLFFNDIFYWGSDEEKKNYSDFISHWNISQSITWFEYRQMLKDIASENFERLGIRCLESWQEIKEDDWLVPIDDDDWFFPSFKESIEKCNEDFIFGDVAFCCLNTGVIDRKNPLPGLLGTAYAFRGWFVLKKRPEDFLDHLNARMLVRENRLSCLRVNELSSYYIQHPGSVTCMSRSEALDVFKKTNKIEINIPDCDNEIMRPCFNAIKEIKDVINDEKKLSDRMRRIYLFT